MKKTFLFVLSFLILLSSAFGADSLDNPNPLEGDLTLPLPGDREIVFRPVFMGRGNGPFAQRNFRMGDPDSGFKEHPTEVSLSGSFLVSSKSGKDWCYYMAKYEISKAQWAVVMDLPVPEGLTGVKPVVNISWFEAQDFLNRINQWLFANELDKLPKAGESYGFLRLPSESEWEFAARGGAAVSSDTFDRRVPYQGALSANEWFAGPKSSHGKLKAAGRLKPNQLGLHDMLGNVTEMTQGLYMIEYYQGRPGGFVARGGHYLSSEKRLRSSLRTEEPFYIVKSGIPAPNKKVTMGFRPVLAAIVFGDRNAVKTYADAWESYRSGAGASMPAAVSTAPTSFKRRSTMDRADQHLTRIEKMVQKDPEILQELGRLKSIISDVKFIQTMADAETAYAWFKIAAERGYFIYRESKKLPTVEKVLKTAIAGNSQAMVEKLSTRMAEIKANISQATENYTASLRQLDTLGPEANKTGQERYLKFLLENDAAVQVRAAKLVDKHLKTLTKTKRTDPDAWQRELSTLGI